MKFSYKFSNLLGTVYHQGSVLFSNDGNTVICPVGNKISLYDLHKNRSLTLPVEGRFSFRSLALSPNGSLLLAADEEGELVVINLYYKNVLYKKRFNKPIRHLKFSPDGKHFALAKDNSVFIYSAPSVERRLFDPFALERSYHAASDDILCIDWSDDSSILVYGSKDMSTHVCAFTKFSNMTTIALTGSASAIVGVYFQLSSLDLITVSKSGQVNIWHCSGTREDLKEKEDIYKRKNKEETEEEEEDTVVNEGEDKQKKGKGALKYALTYRKKKGIFLDTKINKPKHSLKVTTSSYHKKLKLLVTCFASGDFLLLDMTENEAEVLHSLNITDNKINGCCLNSSGDWLAVGSSTLGQLLVWEWQSETYVLKQQGHFNRTNVVAYSSDGQNLATGGQDGKVKLWSVTSSFCFMTFSNHEAEITGIVFTPNAKALLSASLDGTVRAFDLVHYRNFKTLTSPKRNQFSGVTVDAGGDLVAAGGKETHYVFVWSLKTGRLLEMLSGHGGPVSSVRFSPLVGHSMMVSTAWDKSIRVWDSIEESTNNESIDIESDGTFVTVRPDGKQVAIATVSGHIVFIDPSEGRLEGSISGRNDLGLGVADGDVVTAKTNLKSKFFTCLSYSADGKYILASGRSKFVCIYNITERILVKKFEITQNRSFDAMDEIVSRRKIAEKGINLTQIEERGEEDGEGGKFSLAQLPGTLKGDMSLRDFRPEVMVTSLTFSPTGRSWAAATTEGLLAYSLDEGLLFNPVQLQEGVTPGAVRKAIKQEEFTSALLMSLQLNLKDLVREVLEKVPIEAVPMVSSSMPLIHLDTLLGMLASFLESSAHLGLLCLWTTSLLRAHTLALKQKSPQMMPTLSALQKALNSHRNTLGKICSHNTHMMQYLIAQSQLQQRRRTAENEEGDTEYKIEMQDIFNDNFDNDSDDDIDGELQLES